MLQPAKVTTPATAAFALAVQVRAAPAVPLPLVIARVTELVSVATVLPPRSCTVTTGWVPKATPPVEPEG